MRQEKKNLVSHLYNEIKYVDYFRIKPGITNAPITVTLVKPGGTNVDVPVTANGEGNFNAPYTPETVGNWAITACYGGAEYPSHVYTYVCNADLHLKVVEAASPPLIQPPSPAAGIRTEYVYVAAAT